MARTPAGHIEQLPSGSWRAKVYAGEDPLTGRELRFRKTRKTEVEAQIELGKLLELARAGSRRGLRQRFPHASVPSWRAPSSLPEPGLCWRA